MHPVNVPSSVAVGGGTTGLANELSLDAWSGHSSLHRTGNVNASAPSQHESLEDDCLQLEHSAMVMDDAIARMDLQFDVEAPSRPSSDVASFAPFAVTTAGVIAVNDIEPHMHDGGNMGDGTSKGSKKNKEPVFLGGVPFVDLDDYNVMDKRLLSDSEDADDKEAHNRKDMDVDINALSCVQII